MIRIDTTSTPTEMHDYTDISNNSRPSQVCGGCGSDVLFELKFIQDRNLKIERFEVGSDSVRPAKQIRNKTVIYLTYGIQFWCINTRWKAYSEHFQWHQYRIQIHSESMGIIKTSCGRTNLNYTGSSTRVHSRGLQRASNGIIPWPVG
jgi:hypothetical protein